MKCLKCGNKTFVPLKCELTDENGFKHVTFKAIWCCEECLEPFEEDKTILGYLKKYKENNEI